MYIRNSLEGFPRESQSHQVLVVGALDEKATGNRGENTTVEECERRREEEEEMKEAKGPGCAMKRWLKFKSN